MTLYLQSPAGCEVIREVTSVRFDAPDGARGVQPGHEPAVALLRQGMASYRVGEALVYVASEGGMSSTSAISAGLQPWFIRRTVWSWMYL